MAYRRRRLTRVHGGRVTTMVRRRKSPKHGHKKTSTYWPASIFNLQWLFGGSRHHRKV